MVDQRDRERWGGNLADGGGGGSASRTINLLIIKTQNTMNGGDQRGILFPNLFIQGKNDPL